MSACARPGLWDAKDGGAKESLPLLRSPCPPHQPMTCGPSHPAKFLVVQGVTQGCHTTACRTTNNVRDSPRSLRCDEPRKVRKDLLPLSPHPALAGRGKRSHG